MSDSIYHTSVELNSRMNCNSAHIGIGGVIGFLVFIGLLEGNGMGKILWREGEFTPSGLWKYIKSPFFQKYLWYPKLWRHNWIIMSTAGGVVGGMVSYWMSILS